MKTQEHIRRASLTLCVRRPNCYHRGPTIIISGMIGQFAQVPCTQSCDTGKFLVSRFGFGHNLSKHCPVLIFRQKKLIQKTCSHKLVHFTPHINVYTRVDSVSSYSVIFANSLYSLSSADSARRSSLFLTTL